MSGSKPQHPGAAARSPLEFPSRAWRAILKRVWDKTGEDNISLMAAGVAFYGFLSLVPMFGALILSYGLIADPSNVADHVRAMMTVVPADAAKLIYEQLVAVTTSSVSKTGLGLLLALLLSLYGAGRASGAMMSALNVIYDERERRGIIATTMVATGLIAGAVAIGVVGLLAATMLGYLRDLIGDVGAVAAFVIKLATWLVAGMFASCAIALVYRFAPCRADAKWRWLSLGSLVATLLWLLATIGFGLYAAHFGNYNATYGSLGAVVVLLMWLYVSAYVILLGGSFNAETERQTEQDSTTGSPRPKGQRGATVADTSAGDAPTVAAAKSD